MEQVPGFCWTLDVGNFAYSSENILDAYEVLHTYTAHVHCKDRGTENPTSNGIVGTYNKGLRPVSAGDGYKIFRRKPRACPWDEAKKYFSKSLMSISSEYTLQI